MKRIVILAIVAGCVSTWSAPLFAAGEAFALYSWRPEHQPWHFLLIHDPYPKALSTSDVLKCRSPLIGVAALKARLASTPRTTSAVMWRDDPPKKVLRYPPFKMREEIIAFGKQYGLNIEVWPALYE